MRIALVRHGETDWNLTGRLQGVSDMPLNRTGIDQVRRTAGTLGSNNWDVVVSSPLLRAQQSARIIAVRLGKSVSRTYAGLTERDFGDAEGMLGSDALRIWPRLDGPGMESLELVAQRGQEALEAIASDYPSESVIVVCHSFVISHTLRGLGHRLKSDIPNGGIYGLDRTSGGWAMRAS